MGIVLNNSLLIIILSFFALNFSGYTPIQLTEEITFTEEICDNAIDDDDDGLIDLNDPDCDCEMISSQREKSKTSNPPGIISYSIVIRACNSVNAKILSGSNP